MEPQTAIALMLFLPWLIALVVRVVLYGEQPPPKGDA